MNLIFIHQKVDFFFHADGAEAEKNETDINHRDLPRVMPRIDLPPGRSPVSDCQEIHCTVYHAVEQLIARTQWHLFLGKSRSLHESPAALFACMLLTMS